MHAYQHLVFARLRPWNLAEDQPFGAGAGSEISRFHRIRVRRDAGHHFQYAGFARFERSWQKTILRSIHDQCKGQAINAQLPDGEFAYGEMFASERAPTFFVQPHAKA
jgi:hypothetical protein